MRPNGSLDRMCRNIKHGCPFAIPATTLESCKTFEQNTAFAKVRPLPLGLGPTNPCPTAVGMETFSTPVLNAIVKAIAQLNSRYCNQDLHQRPLHAVSRHALLSRPGVPLLAADPVCPVSGPLALCCTAADGTV